MIIAIDGYSSCGKSTIAKGIAAALNFVYIDTGAMYRAVTLYAMQRGWVNMNNDVRINQEQLAHSIDDIHIHFEVNPETKTQQTFLNGKNVENKIRSLEVADLVSEVSKLAFVRKKMVALQQTYAACGNIVMDGRDIGTVVFPHAECKFFVTATTQVRAQRRYDELLAKGEHVQLADVLHNIEQRDFIDSTRSESPLRKADDAVLVDTSNMTREEQLTWILSYITQYRK
ncbi:MAG: (d)CMP kinase [Bacteroidales bacterium]|jgi:cytidylate kinase|nr:(d)CMP kinase [Bacteroidales bacterium]